jgi:diadenosine tetraphosphatase ApaH/serine/threonine PP2A family protein phosphatase
MDRIALISDIHGNLPALEATLRDIERQGIQRIFCLGDLVHDPVDELLAMFDNTEFTGHTFIPDVVGYGDIHEAYLRSFLGRTLFNVGSVGNPHDTPQAAYGVLAGTYGAEAGDRLAIHLIRVPYDIELAIRQARDENMPSLEPYAHELRTAEYRGPGEYAKERDALKKAHGVQ